MHLLHQRILCLISANFARKNGARDGSASEKSNPGGGGKLVLTSWPQIFTTGSTWLTEVCLRISQLGEPNFRPTA